MMAFFTSDVWMIFRAMNSPQASAVKIELWSGSRTATLLSQPTAAAATVSPSFDPSV